MNCMSIDVVQRCSFHIVRMKEETRRHCIRWKDQIKEVLSSIGGGPVRVSDDFPIRFNRELYELLNEIDVVQHFNIQRLPCSAMSFVWKSVLGRDGHLIALYQIEEGLSSIGITNWRRPCYVVWLDVKPGFEPQARHQNKIQKVFLRRFPLNFWQKLWE